MKGFLAHPKKKLVNRRVRKSLCTKGTKQNLLKTSLERMRCDLETHQKTPFQAYSIHLFYIPTNLPQEPRALRVLQVSPGETPEPKHQASNVPRTPCCLTLFCVLKHAPLGSFVSPGWGTWAASAHAWPGNSKTHKLCWDVINEANQCQTCYYQTTQP